MFEKDAEKYADKKCGKENRKTTGWVLTQDDFQKGAEFGYNKANEWHYVKDGDLPKENKKYWILTSNIEPKVDSWLNVSWVNSYDVIAWKEIVLPELKESE